jgi:hypothetical protein
MIHVRNYHKNGNPSWDIKVPTIVIVVGAMVLLSILFGENGSEVIASVWRK